MSTAAALSATLRSRIEQVAGRIRLLRVVRGVSFVVLLLAATGGLALLADYLLDLPAAVRAAVALGWLGLGAVAVLGGLLLPLRRRLDATELAALVEEKYPELGERLTTSVELAGTEDAFHGSPELIALVMQETEKRTYQLPFLSAVPARYAAVLAGAAAVALVVVAAPAPFAPKEYARLTDRLFVSSFLNTLGITHEPAPYLIEVTPGDVIAAQGKTVKVSVRLVPQKPKVQLPATSSLVLIDANGKETTQHMAADSDDAFSADVKLTATGRYRVETRDAVSPTYALTSVVPVELASESPKVVVELPSYARATIETPEPTYGLDDVTVLQHGQVTFDFRFTRPAVNAFVEWTPASAGKGKAEPQILRPTFADDRASATWTLPAKATGTYRLAMEAEHGIITTLAPKTITVQEDTAPQFLKFGGKEELRTVLPYDTVPIDVEATDDIGVAKVAVEYRVNGLETILEEIPVELARDIQARYGFKLAGKVKDGDEVMYRVRVEDNLPREFNGPHVIHYPADRWLRLRIVKKANSLNEQEILAQKTDVLDRLERIKADLKQESRVIFKVHEESKRDPALKPEHVRAVQELRGSNRSIEREMRELVRDLAATPALRRLADRVEDVADTEIKKSQDALDKVDPKKDALARNEKLENADHQIYEALKRLEELTQLNERLAQDRIDQNKLQMLAEREKKLAEQAAELAQADPVRDPKAPEQLESVKKEQAEVQSDLQKLTEQSDKLREALAQDAAEQTRKAAEKAKELAEAQRELNKAAAETEQKRNAEKLSDLAKKQQEIADKADQLAKDTQDQAQAAKTNPLKPEEAKLAADELKKGDPFEALKHQEKSAQDLDRLANALDRAIDLAKDPREAALQLARLEEGLKKKVEDEVKKTDAKEPLADRLKALEEEQKAIKTAAEQLSVPPQNANAKKDKQEVAKQADQATQSLDKNDPKDAVAKMDQTQKTLERLAEQLPNLDQRRQQAQQELDKLRQKQDEIARQSEQAIAQAKQNQDKKRAAEELNKQLADAARKQAENAEQLSKLDVPNQEARQEKTRETLDRALADLMDARKQDVPASQQEAKRELDRLQQALNGQKPADEKARELAKQQRDLAAASRKAAADPKTADDKAQELKRKQQQIARDTRDLNAAEAPQRQAEAADATKKAEEAANSKPTSPEAQKSMDEAARKLDDLAKQLAGAESDAARAERLAKRQEEQAADAERLAKKNQQPSPEDQKRQQQIAEEAKQLRAGEDAKAEKEKALDVLKRAQDANPREKAKTQREAADALRELADKMNGRDNAKDPAREVTAAKPKEQSPQQAARDLAKQQRDLAKATQKAQDEANKQGGDPGKQALEQALKKLGEQQKNLNEQASKLPAAQNEKNLEQARAAMNQAKDTLEKKDAGQAKAKQEDAANALDKLAQALPKEPPQTVFKKDDAGDKKALVPTKEQTDKARELAKEQRDVRDAVKKAQDAANAQNNKGDNPVGALAKQQAEVAKQTADLAKNVGQEQGEKSPTGEQAQQAQQNAQQAAKQMEAGNLNKAQQTGKQTAQQLRQLAQDLAQTPRGKNADPDKPDPLKQARDLAKKQEDINKQMEPLKQDNEAQRTQQTAQQKNLQQQTRQLRETLDQLAKQNKTPKAQNTASQASGSCKECEQAQQIAQESRKQGNQGASQKAGSQAAEALEKAANQANQAAQQELAAQQSNQGQPNGPVDAKAQQLGQSMNEAKGQMGKAQDSLNKGQNSGAKGSMDKAADALARAVDQMNQPGQDGQDQPGQPGTPSQGGKIPQGIQAGGVPDATMFGPEMQKYAGKPWGELPGELRTKIVQDMKTKYGDDYAKMIKLYFEQIADTKKKP